MIEIIAEVHLIHNLKVKLLIDINILDSEEMNISFHNCSLIIDSEDRWEARIHIHAKNNICVCQKIWTLKKQIILSYFFLIILIEFKSALSTDQEFLFTSIYSDAHTHLIDANMQFIYVWNNFNWLIHISLKNNLEKIIEIIIEIIRILNGPYIKRFLNKKKNMIRPTKYNSVSTLWIMAH